MGMKIGEIENKRFCLNLIGALICFGMCIVKGILKNCCPNSCQFSFNENVWDCILKRYFCVCIVLLSLYGLSLHVVISAEEELLSILESW